MGGFKLSYKHGALESNNELAHSVKAACPIRVP